MTKPRQAKLARVQDFHEAVGDVTVVFWIATDSAGRRFRAATREEAVRMLEKYNHPPAAKAASSN